MATPAIAPPAPPVAGTESLPPESETAFFGFLQTFVEVTRALDQTLSARHGVTLAGHEVLNTLARGDANGMRMTDVARRTPRSLSRVSRLVDDLALRGLVERRPCPHDKRSSYVSLTPAGLAFAREVAETFQATVVDRFLGRLSPEETRVLAEVFDRLGGGGGECREALGADPGPEG